MGRIWNIRTYARFVHTPENWLWYRSSPGLYTRSVVLDLVAYWRGVLMGCKVVTIGFCAWTVTWWCSWAAIFFWSGPGPQEGKRGTRWQFALLYFFMLMPIYFYFDPFTNIFLMPIYLFFDPVPAGWNMDIYVLNMWEATVFFFHNLG